jgi:RsiW-degrading membrane proteinase PrsW (M82 family)
MVAIISAGIAPGIALLLYFYLKDQYDTEPIHIVIRMFILGVLLVFPIMFIQYVLEEEHVIASRLMLSFISSGLLEEFFKWFLLMVGIFQHVEFDDPYDGIVYGTSISLGFATLENILFLIGHGLEYALTRALLPVSSHALFGVIMGYYIGKLKFSSAKKARRKWLILSLGLPVFLHGFYDYILLSFENWIYFMLPFMFSLHKAKKARIIKILPSEKF